MEAAIFLPKNVMCPLDEYFDANGLTCTACDSDHKIPDVSRTDAHGNAKNCICAPSFLSADADSAGTSSCALDETRRGRCNNLVCTTTCQTNNQSVSRNGRYCVWCNATKSSSHSSTPVYGENHECHCDNPPPGQESLAQESPAVALSVKRLSEIDDDDGAPAYQSCRFCPIGQAVITKHLLKDGNRYYYAAGRAYEVNPFRCVKCPDANMFFDTSYQCRCGDGFALVGEPSMGEQTCLNKIPSLSTDFSAVTYRLSPESSSWTDKTVAIESLTFSHMYLKEASLCEYFEGADARGSTSCQALGNLCVLQMYDDLAVSCRQFHEVYQERDGGGYHGKIGWKRTLPWLIHRETTEDLETDRGIGMAMSFDEELQFKIAAYDLQGNFRGLRDLPADFFSFCATPNSRTNNLSRSSLQFRFGKKSVIENSCDLLDIVGSEMLFYDLFVVDTSNSCSGFVAGGECLHAVPIAIDNRQNDDGTGDDRDAYVRRFFLFDNVSCGVCGCCRPGVEESHGASIYAVQVSGRTTNGLEIIRYAKFIELKVGMRTDAPDQIYPPRLVIRYAERPTAPWIDGGGNGLSVDLTFRTEFAMDTSKYWATMNVFIGLVSAAAVVLWVFRIRKWQNRVQHKRPYGESATTFRDLYNIVMLGCHSFVIVFFSFVLSSSTWWFVFFKLQGPVFILLPENNDNNGFFFYTLLFHALFWIHSFYLLCTVIIQSRVDFFPIDWERPRDASTSTVSTWRQVMIINEWNRMQTMRATNMEFSTLMVLFLLVGMRLSNSATSQPNLSDLDDGPINPILRFTNISWYWLIISGLQRLSSAIFSDRLFVGKISAFIDMCTVGKISVLILDEPYHGYYLHCRSPFPFADASMAELVDELRKEERGFTTDRGLDAVGAPKGLQKFELFVSSAFRNKLDSLYRRSNANDNNQKRYQLHYESSPNNDDRADPPTKENELMYSRINAFLQQFIEQTPVPRTDGLKRIVKTRSVFESLVGTVPPFENNSGDDTARSELSGSQCIFYPDDLSRFTTTIFLGIETDLIIHHILCHNLCDICFGSPSLSILLTYLSYKAMEFLRGRLGRINISKKALFDDRFFM